MVNEQEKRRKMDTTTEKINDLGIIIAAGGSSKRFSADSSKLLVTSDALQKESALSIPADLPLFMYSVLNFIDLCPEENFIIVVRDEDYARFADYLRDYVPHKNPKLVKGGETRMHSVFNGLNELTASAKFAAVHDAARPFTGKEILLGCLEAARKHDGAVTAKKMTDTVKLADEKSFIQKTVDRSLLWRVETPQIFQTELLKKAYSKAFADSLSATDDAGVMEHSGYTPFLYEHKTNNRKITYEEDIK
jgi:2-C-methyl-D-erythritol 4-phosphate cytidylyltransferase